MPLNIKQNIREVLVGFLKGLVTRIDERDSPNDSLANVVGFNFGEKYQKATKDFGYKNFFATTPVPADCTEIVGVSVLRIEDLQDEFILIFGKKADNNPHFWLRKFKNQVQQAGLLDAWVELTEVVASTIDTVTDASHFISNSLIGYANGYFNSFVAYNTVSRNAGTIIDFDGTTGAFTIFETHGEWVVTDAIKLYRYPDILKLGLDLFTDISDPFYSDCVSNDRLDIGWQAVQPKREVALCLEYIKRNYFNDGSTGFLMKDQIDQHYFGREIPEYSSLGDLGISFNFDVGSVTEVPAADVRTGGWTRVPAGANIYDALDEAVPDDSDYGYTDVLADKGTDLEIQFAPINVAGSDGRIYARIRVSITPTAFPMNPFASRTTLSIGWRKNVADVVSVTAGTKLATLGATSNVKVGDRIVTDGLKQCRTVKSIYNSTTIEVDSNWDNTEASTPYDKIVTIESGSYPVYGGYGQFIVETDIAETETDFGGGFAGNTVDLTFRVQVDNFAVFGNPAGPIRVSVSYATLDMLLFGGRATAMRVLFLPMFNGYLLGKPILASTAVDSSLTALTYYPRVAVDFSQMDRRLTDIYVFDDNGDPNKTLDEFVSAYRFALSEAGQNLNEIPFKTVRVWSFDTSDNRFHAQDAGISSESPQATPLLRVTDGLMEIQDFIGYTLIAGIPSIGANWRYQIKSAIGQQATVVIDESDNVLRLSLYDGQDVHNDHIFPDVVRDFAENPLKLFLSQRGELFGLGGQLGRIYAFKRSFIEVIDADSTRSTVFEADVIAKRGIMFSSIGLVFVGKYAISVMPLHGGLRESLSEAIRDEWIALSDSVKSDTIASECKDLGVLMFSTASACYMYHTDLKIWWKRVYADDVAAIARLGDNTVILGMNDSIRLTKYPDRTTRRDEDGATGSDVPWVIESQWLSFGAADIYKLLRAIEPVIFCDEDNPRVSAVNKFLIHVYLDRSGNPVDSLTSDGSPFWTIQGTTVNGKLEIPYLVKVPNSAREIKFIIKKDPAQTDPIDRFDLSEIRIYGESSVAGREH